MLPPAELRLASQSGDYGQSSGRRHETIEDSLRRDGCRTHAACRRSARPPVAL